MRNFGKRFLPGDKEKADDLATKVGEEELGMGAGEGGGLFGPNLEVSNVGLRSARFQRSKSLRTRWVCRTPPMAVILDLGGRGPCRRKGMLRNHSSCPIAILKNSIFLSGADLKDRLQRQGPCNLTSFPLLGHLDLKRLVSFSSPRGFFQRLRDPQLRLPFKLSCGFLHPGEGQIPLAQFAWV